MINEKNSGIDDITFKRRWITLFTVAATGILVIMDMSIANISFPSLTRVFNTDTSIVLWVTAVYSLVSAGLTPVFGKLGDIYGRKKIFLIGFVLFTVGLGLCAVSQSIMQLIISRAIQGVGAAITMALSMAIVTAVFPDRERGRALGIITACQLVGPLIGPTVGGFLLDTMGWRSIFYFRAPLCIIVLIIAWLLLREQKVDNVSPKVDYWGAALLVSGISCLVLYFNLGGRVSFGEPAILALAFASAVLLAIFILKARKDADAIVDIGLFNNRVFTGGIITATMHSLSLSMQTLVLPYYLIDGLGYSTMISGLLTSIAAVFLIILTPISGWLSDKLGYRILCPAGMALACVSLFMLSRLNSDSTVFQILLPQALFGIGDAIFIAPNNSLIMGSSPRDKLGVASALSSTVRTIGMAAGTVIAGAIFTTRQVFYVAEMAGAGLEESVVSRLSIIGGFQDTVLAAALVLVVATFTSMIGPRKKLSL